MKNLILTIAAVFALFSTACAQKTITGNGNYTTRNVVLEDGFTAITVNGSPDVYYTQSSGKPSVQIYGASNVIPYIEAVVIDGTLVVQFKKNQGMSIINTGKLYVKVSAPDVTTMTVRGSGDIHIEGGIRTRNDLNFKVHGSGDIKGKKLRCNTLTVQVHGSGDINFSEVDCNNTDAKVHGSGDIVLKGKAHNASYHVHGSGDVSARDLQVENVEAYVHGSGDITCFAIDKLSGRVHGSGYVGYRGNPQVDFKGKGLRTL